MRLRHLHMSHYHSCLPPYYSTPKKDGDIDSPYYGATKRVAVFLEDGFKSVYKDEHQGLGPEMLNSSVYASFQVEMINLHLQSLNELLYDDDEDISYQGFVFDAEGDFLDDVPMCAKSTIVSYMDSSPRLRSEILDRVTLKPANQVNDNDHDWLHEARGMPGSYHLICWWNDELQDLHTIDNPDIEEWLSIARLNTLSYSKPLDYRDSVKEEDLKRFVKHTILMRESFRIKFY